MRKIIYIVSALLCVVFTAGCGQSMGQTGTEVPEKVLAEVDTEEAGEETSEDKASEYKTRDIENVEASQDEAEESVDGKESENGNEERGVFADAFDKKIVYENGNYFVRIGNKVYFRDIDPASLEKGAIFGYFLSSETTPVECPLICYDIKTCEWNEAGKITGLGKLYACPEGFYIMGTDQDDPEKYVTYLYDPASGKQEKYCDGMPLGISESGQILAVDKLENGSYRTALIKDGKETGTFGDADTYYEVCGFAGEDIVVAASDDDVEKKILYSGDENGDLVKLGELQGIDYSLPAQEQFIADGKDVYQCFGYYEGTGNFLAGWMATKATCGVKDSLETILDGSNSDTDVNDNVPRIFIDETGQLCDALHLPYEPYMGSDENRNNLYYYDDVFEPRMLVKDFINNSYTGSCSMIQDMIQTGETMFVIYADAVEDPEYDIGWRTGYRVNGWHICAIPFGSDHLGDDGTAKDIIEFN